MLEQQMQELKELPARVERVESQILQLRTEMKSGFSAIRGEMRELREELREDTRLGVEESQNLAKGLHAEAMGAIASVDAAIRHDVVSRLDRLLELQRPGNSPK
jgi:hypothetical protein